jgi:hypothetical protein
VPPRVSAGHNIGELLLREGLITNAQLDVALSRQRETDQPLIRILVEHNMLDETKRLNFFKRQFGVPMVSLANHQIDALLYTYVPQPLARKHHLVPIKLDKDGLVVAMEDPSDLPLLDDLKEIVGLRIKPVVATTGEIMGALEGYPDETPVVEEAPRPSRFDAATRFLSYAFLPIMSAAVLVGIFLLILYSQGVQEWLTNQTGGDQATRASRTFTLFLYFFLSWGVWTIVMFEIRGLVFDDLQWRTDEEVGEPKSNTKTMLFSIFLGWLGIDRFYLGYRRMAIVKLLTLGLFGIWWILDIILIAGRKVPDAAGRYPV